MKIKYVFFVSLFCIGINGKTKSQTFEWGKAVGTLAKDEAYCVAVDNLGAVITTGTFQSVCDFDPSLGNSSLTSAGSYDIFVQKLDASGNFSWARRFGANLADYGQGLATDALGNIYVTGYFQNTVDFDPGAGVANLTSTGSGDIFVIKLSSAGNFIWARNLGSSGQDFANGIAVDEAGAAYTTGFFSYTADFDPGVGIYNLTAVGGEDIFVSKLDSSGNFRWAGRIGSFNDDVGYSVYAAQGFVYFGGEYKGSADFDPGLGTSSLSFLGGADAFVLKMDTAGNFKWAKRLSGADYEKVLGITADREGNVITTGHFENTVDFDPGAGNFSMTDFGILDIFVQKMDSLGNFLWAKQMGGSGFDEGYSVACDSSNFIYVTGYFEDTADFNPGSGIFQLIADGNQDVFVEKLDPWGNLISANRVGSPGIDFGYSIRIHQTTNDIVFAGSHYGLMDLDPSPGVSNVGAVGSWDIYNCKWGQCNVSNSVNENSCGAFTSPSGNFLWDSSGTYTDILPTGNGCDSVLTVTLTVVNLDTGVSVNGNTLSANSAGLTYQWVDCNSGYSHISSQTQQSFSPGQSGNYAVVISGSGCSDTSSCRQITILANAPNENQIGFQAYPNPTQSKLQVSFSPNYPSNLQLFSATGLLISQYQNSSSLLELDLSAFPPGLYMLHAEIQGKSYARKIILSPQ